MHFMAAEEKSKNVLVLSFIVHLYQLKGMQNSKLGRVWERGTICQQKVYERSTFSSKNSI